MSVPATCSFCEHCTCGGTPGYHAFGCSHPERKPTLRIVMHEAPPADCPLRQAERRRAFKQLDLAPRRVESRGFIRWYVNNECVAEATTDAYYRNGHIHPEGCQCDALVHDAAFRESLKAKGFG